MARVLEERRSEMILVYRNVRSDLLGVTVRSGKRVLSSLHLYQLDD